MSMQHAIDPHSTASPTISSVFDVYPTCIERFVQRRVGFVADQASGKSVVHCQLRCISEAIT